MKVQIKKLLPDATLHVWPNGQGLTLAAYTKSLLGHPTKLAIPPNSPRLIRTAISLVVPDGCMAFLLSRREDAKHALQVINAPAPLDHDNEVKFVVHNAGLETHYVLHGDLIANLIVLSGTKMTFEVV